MKNETFLHLKDLRVIEDLKFPASADVRKHYLVDWLKFSNPFDLAEKLDDYESIRKSFKKKDPTKEKKTFLNFEAKKGSTVTLSLKKMPKIFFQLMFPVTSETSSDEHRDTDFRKPHVAMNVDSTIILDFTLCTFCDEDGYA
ncbi:hypothetical protein NPIL_364801 [Nephila pilipes]|uniref:Uncharacterized protein n=1 Tax=Nephila pilipes TaxID=299642 RepID=A0A8X6J0B7_NEPPI|nr:hypothetical protein NPIL_364801 [Nephila pilipes]